MDFKKTFLALLAIFCVVVSAGAVCAQMLIMMANRPEANMKMTADGLVANTTKPLKVMPMQPNTMKLPTDSPTDHSLILIMLIQKLLVNQPTKPVTQLLKALPK